MTIEPNSNYVNRDENPAGWDDRTPLEPEDDRWDAFLPDDDQHDPLPEPGDFWVDPQRSADPLAEDQSLRWAG